MLTEASSLLELVPGEIFMALTNLSEQMIILLNLLLWANVLDQLHLSFHCGWINAVCDDISCARPGEYSLFDMTLPFFPEVHA